MPFQRILSRFLSHGVEAVAVLDSEGEMILSMGNQEPEIMKLIGAYQGIVLSAVRRSGMHSNTTVITVAGQRSIVTHHLLDGYFVSLVLTPGFHYACMRFYLEGFYDLLAKELS